jgi:hypothetical protein
MNRFHCIDISIKSIITHSPEFLTLQLIYLHSLANLTDCAVRSRSLDAPDRVAGLFFVQLALAFETHYYVFEPQGFQMVNLLRWRQLVELACLHT